MNITCNSELTNTECTLGYIFMCLIIFSTALLIVLLIIYMLNLCNDVEDDIEKTYIME